MDGYSTTNELFHKNTYRRYAGQTFLLDFVSSFLHIDPVRSREDVPKVCSICLQPPKNSVERELISGCENAKHLFHSSCLSEWCKMSPKCPICRRSLESADVDEQVCIFFCQRTNNIGVAFKICNQTSEQNQKKCPFSNSCPLWNSLLDGDYGSVAEEHVRSWIHKKQKCLSPQCHRRLSNVTSPDSFSGSTSISSDPSIHDLLFSHDEPWECASPLRRNYKRESIKVWVVTIDKNAKKREETKIKRILPHVFGWAKFCSSVQLAPKKIQNCSNISKEFLKAEKVKMYCVLLNCS